MGSAHPELLLLSAALRSGDHKALRAHGITPQMFHTYSDEAKWLFAYIDRHGKMPSKTAFRNAWPGADIYKVDDLDYYADEVKREHAREGVLNLLDKAVEAVESDDPDRVLRVIQSGLADVQSRTRGLSEDYDAFADWEATYNTVAARVDRVASKGFAGVPTGFPTLDTVTGGMQPGWLGIIGARLGQGKTWTGVRMGFAAAATKHRVLYYSLEQNRHQIAMRLHSFASAKYGQYTFNSLDLNRGRGFDLREYKRFLDSLKDNLDGKFFINDSSRGTVGPANIRAGIEQTQPDIVFIDYITLMGTSGDDWRSTAKLSGELQSIGQQYGVPIVAASQINRLGAGTEPPGTENLSQADAIGQDADVVMTMAQKSKHVMKLKLAKFRHGPSGVSWYCKFSPGTGQYEEITGDEADRLVQKDNDLK